MKPKRIEIYRDELGWLTEDAYNSDNTFGRMSVKNAGISTDRKPWDSKCELSQCVYFFSDPARLKFEVH